HRRAHVNYNDLARLNSLKQGLTIHGTQFTVPCQEATLNLLDLRQPIFAKHTIGTEKVGNEEVCERIDHKTSAPARFDEGCRLERVEMVRGVCHAHAGLSRQVFYGASSLAEQIKQFEALRARESFADASQLTVRGVLEFSLCGSHGITHYNIQLNA